MKRVIKFSCRILSRLHRAMILMNTGVLPDKFHLAPKNRHLRLERVNSNAVIFCIATLMLWLCSCSKKDGEPLLPDLPSEDTIVEQPVQETVSIPAVDNDMIAFMAKYNVPGASIAIVKDEKLVYAKGYGYADTATLKLVDTSSRFRIASLTKFITSLGILKLVEAGKLRVSDKVFGSDGILGTEYGTIPYPTYIEDITVEHLLHHELGGWGNSSSDPAFAQSSISGDSLISWVINNRPLTDAPGTKTNYSNMGFLILGKIIEKVSGKEYVQFIQDSILTPSGVHDMEIGAAKKDNRKSNEVVYYGQSGQNPYGYATNIFPRMEAYGAWIAKPIDYARIIVHADKYTSVTDILKPESLTLLSTPSSISNYGYGIRVSTINKNWYHGGSLSGTRTWFVRTYNGYTWVIFFNTRSTASAFGTDLDKLIWPAVNSSSTIWPVDDLF